MSPVSSVSESPSWRSQGWDGVVNVLSVYSRLNTGSWDERGFDMCGVLASLRKWILCTHTSRELTSAFESVQSSFLYFEFVLTIISFYFKYRITTIKHLLPPLSTLSEVLIWASIFNLIFNIHNLETCCVVNFVYFLLQNTFNSIYEIEQLNQRKIFQLKFSWSKNWDILKKILSRILLLL